MRPTYGRSSRQMLASSCQFPKLVACIIDMPGGRHKASMVQSARRRPCRAGRSSSSFRPRSPAMRSTPFRPAGEGSSPAHE
jgi:hypothetical protein